MYLTKFNITNYHPYKERQKKMATEMLERFKWSEEQKTVLKNIAAKGYYIGIYNEVVPLFGKIRATDGDRKMILAISTGKRKKDLSIYAN